MDTYIDMIHIYKYIDMIPAGQNGPLPGKAVSWKKENRTRHVFDHKMLEGLTKASCDELFLRNFFGPRMCVWLARERRFWEIMGRWKIRRDIYVCIYIYTYMYSKYIDIIYQLILTFFCSNDISRHDLRQSLPSFEDRDTESLGAQMPPDTSQTKKALQCKDVVEENMI